MRPEQISACIELCCNHTGNTTWIPVDLETETREGNFQVFNTFTGLHESFSDLPSAKQRFLELKSTLQTFEANNTNNTNSQPTHTHQDLVTSTDFEAIRGQQPTPFEEL